jgi:hypothetical protein
VGPQGPAGPRGEAGPVGPAGQDGQSTVVDVEYPLVLKDNKISLDAKHIDKILGKFKGADTQKIIDYIGKLSVPGGGGLAALVNGNYVAKYVGNINFTGAGVNVTASGQNLTVNIPGGNSPIIGVTIFTEAPSEEEPGITRPGDRWFNTDTGILYTAITGASGFIWVQL